MSPGGFRIFSAQHNSKEVEKLDSGPSRDPVPPVYRTPSFGIRSFSLIADIP